LVGTAFWSGLLDWINSEMLLKEKNVSPEDLNLYKVVDTAEEVVDEIFDYYSKYNISINF
jgi:predicted Rossmann-fold nucleotide-binding protein